MQAFTELTQPTAVTHAITAPFICGNSINLIIAKTSLIQVFEIRTSSPSGTLDGHHHTNGNVDASPFPSFVSLHAARTAEHKALVLLGEFPVAGTITSLATAKVPNTRSGGDLLLVALKNAKVSLVEWDPSVHGISTLSIHYFEGDDDRGAPWMPCASLYSSYLTTDPRNVCAALKFGRRGLAILPFGDSGGEAAADAMVDDDDADVQLRRKTSRGGEPLVEKRSLPCSASYTLQTTMLDADLIDPIDIAFLYEYREPTLGVLAASAYPSDSLVAERKDSLTYTTFTIDVEEHACTQLLTIKSIPLDVFKLLPLSPPVGGVLLVGCNELIHIDQSGKIYAVAVNEFALHATSFSMNNQSDLGLRLEGSITQKMSSNMTSLLIVLRTGELATLSFKMEGRTMAGMFVKRISADRGGHSMGGAASCAAMAGLNTVFIGSQQSDALLLECQSSMPELTRKRSHAEMLGLDEDAMAELGGIDDEDEDDDLYGNDIAPKKRASMAGVTDETPSDITFIVHDHLPNYSSLSGPAVAKRIHTKDRTANVKLELALPTGCGSSGALTLLTQSIPTSTSAAIETDKRARRVWSVATREGSPVDVLVSLRQGLAPPLSYDRYLIIDYDSSTTGSHSSGVRHIQSAGTVDLQDTEFECDVETISVGTLAGGTRVVQISPTEVRTYDQELAFSQILEMADEETGTEFTIRHASFADPYLMLIRDDGSAMVLQVDQNGDLQEIEKGSLIQDTPWTSGCIHNWATSGSDATLYLLSERGALYLFSLPNLSAPIFVAEELRFLPPILTSASAARRGAMPEALAEILVADLGDTDSHSPFLIVRTENDDVEVYEPFSLTRVEQRILDPKQLRWIRRPCSFAGSLVGAFDEASRDASQDSDLPRPCLSPLNNFNGHSAIFIPGKSPSLIVKETSSAPRVLPLDLEDISSLTCLHSPQVSGGFTIVDANGVVKMQQPDRYARYGDIGWAVRRLNLGEEVEHVAYHSDADRYAIGVNRTVEFDLPDDEAAHHAWVKEDISFRPESIGSTVRLLDPTTWTVTDTFPLHHATEQILCMTVANMEVSEHTHERRMLLAVGTSLNRGEDLPALGSVYLIEIVRVAPEPGLPGTGLILRLLVREEVRGAVTGLCEAGAQGLLMMAMGQKLNVRGLTEAKTLLPAAFMDVQEHVTLLKNLKGTGMCLAADAFKGIWFAGFQAEPYKMSLFGKSRTELPIVATDFLPSDKQLFIIMADIYGDIHMLEYNPESPSSLSGQRLLHRAAVHSGHEVISMTLLPCSPASFLSPTQDSTDVEMTNGDSNDASQMPGNKDPLPTHQVLVLHASGSISLVHALSEGSYRRLTALQAYLTSALDAPCALNPRTYRAVDPSKISYKGAVQEGSTIGAAGGTKTVVDGALVGRWRELGVRGRNEAWGRVGNFLGGGDLEVLAGIKEVEILNGAGLSFL